jgi:hypothetical protein
VARRKSSGGAVPRRSRTVALARAIGGALVQTDRPLPLPDHPLPLISTPSGYPAPMKDRSVWPECREAGTHRCAGSNAASECICWHHVLQQRHVEHALEVLVQIERELEWIGGR